MDNDHPRQKEIVNKLIHKSNLKLRVFDKTFAALGELKEVLHELSTDIDEACEDSLDRRIRIEYRDRGKFEAQVQIAGDIIIFSMHSNVFEFSDEHPIKQINYVQENPNNSFCGVINIYNFLSDSFKFNRNSDEGYLIGRIFINQNNMYFVEGNISSKIKCQDFGTKTINKDELIDIIESAIDYTLDFDLLVQPYENAKLAEVDQFNTKFENSKMQTGKRLGYNYDVDKIF